MAVQFDIIGRGSDGALRALRVAADGAAEATASAQNRGLQVLRCEPVAGAARKAAAAGRPRARRARRWDAARFAQDLAGLVSAGLQIPESIATLSRQASAAAHRGQLEALGAAVSQGLSLSAAMDKSGGFPPLLVATVIASEQSGDLAPALERYAQHQLRLQAVRDRVVGASIYPMLLLAVGVLVVVFLMAVVVPKFAVLIESTRAELPWSSRLLIEWGRVFARHSGVLGLVLAGLVLAALLQWRRLAREGFRQAWIEQLPFIGELARKFRQAQFFRTAGMLLQGGLAAPRALRLAASLLGERDHGRLRAALRQIEAGRDLGDALEAARLTDDVATSMLGVARRSGSLAEVLDRIATLYERDLERSIDVGARLFEPLLMIVIGLVIGLIVVLMYMPIFDLASSLQ